MKSSGYSQEEIVKLEKEIEDLVKVRDAAPTSGFTVANAAQKIPRKGARRRGQQRVDIPVEEWVS